MVALQSHTQDCFEGQWGRESLSGLELQAEVLVLFFFLDTWIRGMDYMDEQTRQWLTLCLGCQGL